MQSANVYKFGDRVIVCSLSKTTAGVWIVHGTVTAVAVSNQTGLGGLVLAALDGSISGIPHPKVWSGLFDPVLREAGVKTYSAFIKKASLIDVRRNESTVALIPMQNQGAKDGFLPDENAKHSLENPAADALGQAVTRLLAR